MISKQVLDARDKWLEMFGDRCPVKNKACPEYNGKATPEVCYPCVEATVYEAMHRDEGDK